MPENNQSHLEKVLAGFSEARTIIKANNDSIEPLGYEGSKFHFYRFVNRYRLAVNFQGVIIHDFEKDTADTYGDIHKLFLMWSTFEMYCELCDQPYHAIFRSYPKFKIHTLANAYKELDSQDFLIDFLIRRSNVHGQDEFMNQFKNGNNLRVITIAACIRHIYAHGHLTAHPQGMTAEATSAICKLFTSFISNFIINDFQTRLAKARQAQ